MQENRENLQTPESVVVNEQIKKLVGHFGAIEFWKGGTTDKGMFLQYELSTLDKNDDNYYSCVFDKSLSESFSKLQFMMSGSKVIEGKEFFDNLEKTVVDNHWGIKLTRNMDELVVLSDRSGGRGYIGDASDIEIKKSGHSFEMSFRETDNKRKLDWDYYSYLNAIVKNQEYINNL